VTLGRYVESLVLIAVALVPMGAAAVVWRRHLVPGWDGPVARLAEIVLGIASVIVVTEVLGSIHLFRLAAVAPVLAVVGSVGWYAGNRRPARAAAVGELVGPPVDATAEEPPPDEAGSGPMPRGASLVAVIAVSVVAADWFTRTVDALHHGMTSADTLWYHMPFAARFVQQGSITPLHYVDSEAVTVFFPATSELVHALGIMFMGNDLASPLVNLGWAGVALLAGWCVGRPYGVAPVTLTGVAALLATPGLVATQPGGAYDDIVGLALLLSSAALLVTAAHGLPSNRMCGQAMAALATGLALGTKFTLVASVAALTVGIWIVARRGRRWFETGVWLLLVAVTGGFWYLRNWIIVGNPLPSLHLKLGPISLPSPKVGTPTSTVSHFLLNGSAWRHFLFPGLRLSFGPVWWALLGLAAVGLVLGLAAGPGRMPRMLAGVGLVSGAAFLVTPQYLTILGAPYFFVDNVRYGDPAVVLGLVLLPLAAALRGGWQSWGLLAGYGGIVVLNQLDGTLWPTSILSQRFDFPVGGIDSLIGLLCGVSVLVLGVALWLVRSSHVGRTWRPPVAAVVVVVVAVLAVGFALQQFYLTNRYADADNSVLTEALRLSNSRIAVIGDFAQIQYEFYGKNLTNYVQYVGVSEPDHGFAPVATCAQLRDILNAGHYDYVVTTTGKIHSLQDFKDEPTDYAVWTSTDPATTLVSRAATKVRGAQSYIGYSLFRIDGRLDPATCPRPSGPAAS
jgi:hypothetical protein